MKLPHNNSSPLIVILGQTGSGKSALAMELASKFNGEIIAADSRTIYKGMDIGTAKPTLEEQKSIVHHLVDVLSPDQSFTAAEFQARAKEAIKDIAARGRTPFLVGGSGLYIDTVIYNFSFRKPADSKQRQKLQSLSVDELRALLEEKGIALPENSGNPRHLIRALETQGEVPQRSELRSNTLVIGVARDKEELEQRISARVDTMIEEGFIDEVKSLSSRYEWDAPGLQAPGYKEIGMYINGLLPLEEAKRQFIQRHLQYAKRQKTWFKRNSDIVWISNTEEAVDLVTTFLNK